MAEWFRDWFNEDYLALYPHRDQAEADRAVGLLTRHLPWRRGWRVLDVGCGAGRHAHALVAAGARPVGLDLSAALLRRAKAAQVPLVRADMRWLPIRAKSADLVVNLFTSFGYFERDDDHAAALLGMAESLVDGGWLAMDFLHAGTVRAGLVAEETQQLGGWPVRISRELEDGGRRVVKTIRLPDGRQFQERVRLFEPEELETMFDAAGLAVQARFGDYDGGPLMLGSPRTILIARQAS